MTDAERLALIDAALTTPSSASVDGRSVTSRSIDDILKAIDRATAVEASRKKTRGLRFARIVPPGATGTT